MQPYIMNFCARIPKLDYEKNQQYNTTEKVEIHITYIKIIDQQKRGYKRQYNQYRYTCL